MQTDIIIGADKALDVRSIPCSVKHGLILRVWLELPVGDYFTLLNSRDPVPLFHEFSAHWPEAFTWEHLVNGPDEVRIKITKLKPAAPIDALPECSRGH